MAEDIDKQPKRAREILLTDVRINFATLFVLIGILVSILGAWASVTTQLAVLRADLNAQQQIADSHATGADLEAFRQLVELQLEALSQRVARIERSP